MKKLDQHIKEIKGLGDLIARYKLPTIDDKDAACLKLREVYVDGYQMYIHYNKALETDYTLYILQIFGKYTPFLPFNVVVKVVKKFFDKKGISLVDFFQENRKIYCWTLMLDHNDEPITPEENYEEFIFEDFTFNLVNRK